MSPSASVSADFASMIAAPVRSRRSLTSLAEMLMTPPSGPRGSAGAREQRARPAVPLRPERAAAAPRPPGPALRPRPSRPPRPPAGPSRPPPRGALPPPPGGASPPPRRGAWPPPGASSSRLPRSPRRSCAITSEHERIASSLPGIGKSTGTGSTFESTRPMIGSRRRFASATAISSVFRSITNTASGRRFMSRTPPRLYSSFSSSAWRAIRSLVGSRSSWPESASSRSSWRRSIRFDIVLKFVRSPPSQRWFT